MAKTKKINREYVISDSSVNVYGFRLLTAGYLKAEFERNPIGYYMHDRESGVVVRWEDIRIEGDKIIGKPVINLSNARGQQTMEEVENGFLNGASVGHIVALELSEDPKDMLPGQYGPTVTKWYNRECSLCDVPANLNGLVLFDKDGMLINLADFRIATKNDKHNMKQIFLTAEQLKALLPALKAEATQEEVDTALKALKAEADKVPDLTTKLATAISDKKKAEDDLADYKKTAEEKNVDDAVDAAVDKKLCTVETGKQLKVAYKGNLAGLTALIATFKPYESKTKSLKGDEDTRFDGKNYGELDKAGLLEGLKAKDENKFFDLFKAEFGKPHSGDKREA